MRKIVFILIVVLMSVSLIGIIFVQLFWINNALESKKAQFKNDIQKSLGAAAERINEREQVEFQKKIENLIAKKGLADKAELKSYLIQQIDTTTKEKITFGGTFLEENFKLPTDFLNNDSIIYKRVTGKKDFFRSSLIKSADNYFPKIEEVRYSFIKSYSEFDKLQARGLLNDINTKKLIHERISNNELNRTIKEELAKRNIHLDFKYGIYSLDGLATKLKSGYYTINTEDSFKYPLFYDSKGNISYNLMVTFPDKNEHILEGISNILLLSLFFILIIIIAFSSSLYQVFKQDVFLDSIIRNITIKRSLKEVAVTASYILDWIGNSQGKKRTESPIKNDIDNFDKVAKDRYDLARTVLNIDFSVSTIKRLLKIHEIDETPQGSKLKLFDLLESGKKIFPVYQTAIETDESRDRKYNRRLELQAEKSDEIKRIESLKEQQLINTIRSEFEEKFEKEYEERYEQEFGCKPKPKSLLELEWDEKINKLQQIRHIISNEDEIMIIEILNKY